MSDEVKPWDMLFGEKVPGDISSSRLEICKGCEFFRKGNQTCKKCGCFMKAKSMLANARCPIGKW